MRFLVPLCLGAGLALLFGSLQGAHPICIEIPLITEKGACAR